MKVSEVYEEYINFTPLSSRTKNLYFDCYNSFWIMLIGNLDITAIDYNIIQRGINDLIEKYSYNTVKIYKCAVFKFLNVVQLKNNITYSWINCISSGKPPKKKEFNCNKELHEFYDLIIYIKNSKSKLKKQYEVIIWLGFYTGLRIGEVLALTKNDIDLKRRELHISKNISCKKVDGKNTPYINTVKSAAGNRTIYIPDELKNILIEYIQKSNRGILFSNKKGGYIIPSNISSFIRNFARPREYTIHFHSLRVLYTKIMLDNHASLESVRALLGHANASTTLDIYLRNSTEERKADVYKVFNQKNFKKLNTR